MTARPNHAILLKTIIILLLLLLPACAARAAGELHTILLPCEGGGYVGRRAGKTIRVRIDPRTDFRDAEGETWTLETLAALPGFRLEAAALRFNVSVVRGGALPYSLLFEESFSQAVKVPEGKNIWDVTSPVSAWLRSGPGDQGLTVTVGHKRAGSGIHIDKGSVYLQLTFTADADLPLFPRDRIQEEPWFDAGFQLLEEGNPFIAMYDETAGSLITSRYPLGIPYYFGGMDGEKLMQRYYPRQTTGWYRSDRLFFRGLDCGGLTQMILQESGLEPHPHISQLVSREAGAVIFTENSPDRWPLLLAPGDLIAMDHGHYFHILMYVGTLRSFGWTAETAGEAAPLLDQPLVLHCGGSPFYYYRYQAYIEEMGYKDTCPPDGGATVSVILPDLEGAPHTETAPWLTDYGWYMLGDDPLLIFPLTGCSSLAWYGLR